MHQADKCPLLQPYSPNTYDRFWTGVTTQYHPCLTSQGTTLINQHTLITWLGPGHTKNLCRNSKSPESYPSALTSLFPKLPSSSSLLCQHPGEAGRSCCNLTFCRTRPLHTGSAMWNNCLLLMLCALSSPEHNVRSLAFRDPAELVKREEKTL